MIVAYLFSNEPYGDFYGQPIRRRFWRILLALGHTDETIYLSEGDLLVSRIDDHTASLKTIADRLSGSKDNDPLVVNPVRLIHHLQSTRVYLQVLENVPETIAVMIHQCLLGEGYIGGVTLNPSDPIQQTFYRKYTKRYGSYTDGRLDLFHEDDFKQTVHRDDFVEVSLDALKGTPFDPNENGTSD